MVLKCEIKFILLVEMSAVTSRRRVSYAQLEMLWEFLNTNRDIALGFNKTVQARENLRRLWSQIAESLNAVGDGAFKDWKGWSAYWVDYKGKLKRKCAALRASRSRTGGGPSEASELSELEKKYLIILGEDFGAGLPGVQVDPFPGSDTNASSEQSPSLLLPSPPAMEIEVANEPEDYGRPTNSSSEQLQVVGDTQPQHVAVSEPQAESSVVQPIRIRRLRRRPQSHTVTHEAARQSLITLSQQRVQNEQTILQRLTGIEQVLTRIADTLDRMERRFHAAPTTE